MVGIRRASSVSCLHTHHLLCNHLRSNRVGYNSIMEDHPMSTDTRDPRIDQYIHSLPDWQQHICRRVRALVHTADPEVIETIKFTNRPYFTLNGNVCALLAAKDHVNIFIYDPIAPDPEGIINQGQSNKTARAIQIRQGEPINERALLRLFQAVIANNRAGGWRKLQGNGSR